MLFQVALLVMKRFAFTELLRLHSHSLLLAEAEKYHPSDAIGVNSSSVKLEQLLASGPCWVTKSASVYHAVVSMIALSGFLEDSGKNCLFNTSFHSCPMLPTCIYKSKFQF